MASRTILSLASSLTLKNSHRIPMLGFGTYENINCAPACLAALGAGYRQIDTARYYRNEDQVGLAVKQCGIPREDVFVTSKIYHPEHGYEQTLQAVDDSLRKFGHEYFDLYLIHSGLLGKEKRLETWRALITARNAGKIKSIGVSNCSQRHIEEMTGAGFEMPVVNQIELHPFCQQRPIVEYCKKQGIVVQAYCPLIMGKLDHPLFLRLANQHGKDAAQIAIRWSLQHGFIPLPKSARQERVRSNADVFDFELCDEEMAAMDLLDKGSAGAITWNPVDAP